MQIKKALPPDHGAVTQVMRKSKAYWGYSDEQMKIWENELTVRPNDIEVNQVYKLTNKDDLIIGFYSFKNIAPGTAFLNDLFILPEFIGQGLGKLLLNDFLNKIKNEGINKVRLAADPNAEPFYLHFNFSTIGRKESSIKGRYMPVMEKEII